MQIVGVHHSFNNEMFASLVNYLSNMSWKGKRVAIEFSPTNDSLYDRMMGDDFYRGFQPDVAFWREIVKLIESRGGKIIPVDHPRLLQQHWAEVEGKNESDERGNLEKEISFKRTVRLIHTAQKEKCDFVIIGAEHAYHIKKILGRKANVHIFLPPRELVEYSKVNAFIKRKVANRARKERQWADLFSPALRNEKKFKRPRLREGPRRVKRVT